MKPLAEIERDHCLATIKQLGSVVRAAKALGISKTTLYRKLPEWRRQTSADGNTDSKAAEVPTKLNSMLDDE